jgi:hypothetical protein
MNIMNLDDYSPRVTFHTFGRLLGKGPELVLSRNDYSSVLC